MFHDSFTTVIIGNDILAHLIAIECASKNKKTCLIAQRENFLDLYLRHAHVLKKKLSFLGIAFENYLQNSNAFQILSPLFRLDCVLGHEELTHEFEREFSESPPSWQRFLSETPLTFRKKNYLKVRSEIEKKHAWTDKLSYPFSTLPYLQNFFLYQKDGAYVSAENHKKLILALRKVFQKKKGTIKETDVTNIKRSQEKWVITTKSYEGTVFTHRIITTCPLENIKYPSQKISHFLQKGEYQPIYTTSFYFKKDRKPEALKDHFLYILHPQKRSLSDNIWSGILEEEKKEFKLKVNFFSNKTPEMINHIHETLHHLIPFAHIEKEDAFYKGSSFYHSFSSEKRYDQSLMYIDKNWHHFGPETGAWLGLTAQLLHWESFK